MVVRRARTPLVLASAFLASFTLPGPAAAYRTAADLPEFDDDATIAWPTREIPYRVHTAMPAGLDRAAALAAIEAAAATWNAVECTDVQLVFAGFTDEPPVAGDDVNTIAFVQTDWTAMGRDADAAATTDVRYGTDERERTDIAEADILLNSFAMGWTTVSPSSPERRDLQAVVTHELGHVLGLLHPCELGGAEGAPACGPSHDGASLHPTYFGALQRRLGADDVEGICSLYPRLPCFGACPEGLECTPAGCRAPCGSTHCPLGHVCADEATCEPVCEGGCYSGVLGDPCESDRECGGSCASDGYCTTSCVPDAPGACGANWQCDSTSTCAPTSNRSVLGARCDAGAECVSGLCLFEEARGHCTRTCEGGCPDGFTCVEADDQAVCRLRGGAGCAAGGVPSGAWLPLLFLIARRRRA